MLKKEEAKSVNYQISKNGCKYKVYHFQCSECNNDIKAQSSHLKTHSGKCQRCSQLGDPYKHIYNELKNHHNKKISFDLNYEEFLSIIEKAVCEYCNKQLVYNKHSKYWGKCNSRAYQLDRKDNTKGYSLANSVPCCWACNRLKSDVYSYEEFLLLKPILSEIHKYK